MPSRSTLCHELPCWSIAFFLFGLMCADSTIGAPATPEKRELDSPVTSYEPGPLLRRFLDGPMSGCEEIIFATRVPGRDHWYVTFGNYASFLPEPTDRAFKKEDGVLWGYGEGARLCRMNLRTGKLTVLLEDMKGGIRDPQLHYDGQKILFAYRKGGEHPFHLYEINVDGTGLTQLTDGPDEDIEPAYCPDGSIVFCSSRCRRFVNCWHTRVASREVTGLAGPAGQGGWWLGTLLEGGAPEQEGPALPTDAPSGPGRTPLADEGQAIRHARFSAQ